MVNSSHVGILILQFDVFHVIDDGQQIVGENYILFFRTFIKILGRFFYVFRINVQILSPTNENFINVFRCFYGNDSGKDSSQFI